MAENIKSEQKEIFEVFFDNLQDYVATYVHHNFHSHNVEDPFELKIEKKKFRYGSLEKTTTDIYKFNVHQGNKVILETLIDVRFNDHHKMAHISVPRKDLYKELEPLVENLSTGTGIKVTTFEKLPSFRPYGRNGI